MGVENLSLPGERKENKCFQLASSARRRWALSTVPAEDFVCLLRLFCIFGCVFYIRFVCLFVFQDPVSFCSSPGRPGTHFVD